MVKRSSSDEYYKLSMAEFKGKTLEGIENIKKEIKDTKKAVEGNRDHIGDLRDMVRQHENRLNYHAEKIKTIERRSISNIFVNILQSLFTRK